MRTPCCLLAHWKKVHARMLRGREVERGEDAGAGRDREEGVESTGWMMASREDESVV